MALTVRRLRRLESWTTWKAAGGVRQAVLSQALSAKASITLIADRLSIVFPIDSPSASFFSARSVIRIDQSDTVYDEWKVVDRSTDHAAGTITVNAASLRATDLAESALVERIDSDGSVIHDFESLGLTPALMVSTWIIPALASAGFTWITAGTITPTAPVDLTFSWDTPLSALLRLAEISKSELDIRRTGDTGYVIDLVAKVNTTATRADLRVDKNLLNVQRDESTIEQATRVFPRGMAVDNERATMARAQWKVTTIVGTVVTLTDPAGGTGPLVFDSQLNGKYLRKADGTLTLVSASSKATQTVTVASATGITVGDSIGFRENSAGRDMVSLDNPAASTAYGTKVAVHDSPDIPGTNNLLKNPFMRDWTGTLPVGWTAVNAPTIAKQTAAPFTALGGQSIKVTSTTDGQGVVSDTVPIFLSATQPWTAGYARIWVASGQVRTELLITTPTGVIVVPTGAKVASSSVQGQWEDLGVTSSAVIAGYSLLASAVAIRIVQQGTGASVFYVDAGEITATPAQEPLVEGSGGTRLWQEANELLRTGSLPIVSYTIPLVDLEQLDPVVWSETALTIGADARVVDSKLGFDIATRIIEINRDYLSAAGTTVVLSNKFDDLTDLLAAFKRSGRRAPDIAEADTGGFDATIPPIISYTVTPAGVLSAKVAGSEGTYTTRIVGRIDRAPTGDEVDASTPSTGGIRTGVFPNLVTVLAGKRFYLAAAAYTASGVSSVIARISEVWLGLGSTDGADVIIGDIIGEATQITYPVAFDDECAYCEIWTREYTTNPGVESSAENLAGLPFRVLSLGPDAMVPGIAYNLSIPIAASTNWLLTTFVPFDHLGKRGNIQTFRNQGSSGTSNPEAPTFLSGLMLWLDASQETFANGAAVGTWTDRSGNGNHATQATAGLKPIFTFDVDASMPGVHFSGGQNLIFDVSKWTSLTAAEIFIVMKRDIATPVSTATSGIFALGADTTNESNIPATDGQIHDGFGSTAAKNTGVSWTGSTDVHIYNVSSIAGEWVDRFDGVQLFSTVTNVVGFNGTMLRIGGGYAGGATPTQAFVGYLCEIVCYNRKLTADERYTVTQRLANRWPQAPFPPLPVTPAAPAGAVQLSNTSTSITVRVTMSATAPDAIRLLIGGPTGTRSYDEAVTVAGGATQDFVITDLTPETDYTLGIAAVKGGLRSPYLLLNGTTKLGGVAFTTLNAPSIANPITYNVGDQAFTITVIRGANNPLDTVYHLEYDEVPTVGYVEDVSAQLPATALVNIFPQTVGAATQRNFRVWATRSGWTTSARSAPRLGTAPGG